jgi:hypothetical protein
MAVLLVLLGVAAALIGAPIAAGWGRLGKAYPADDAPPVDPLLHGPYFRSVLCPVWAGVAADRRGLYLVPVLPAALCMRAVPIPWDEMAETERSFGWRWIEVRGRRVPELAVYIIGEFYDELRAHNRPVEPVNALRARAASMGAGTASQLIRGVGRTLEVAMQLRRSAGMAVSAGSGRRCWR